MNKAWKEYQEEAAAFFRSLGLIIAEVEARIKGIRGLHN
jgi:hypothetical protein